MQSDIRTKGSFLFHFEVELASLVMKAENSLSVATDQFTLASGEAELPGGETDCMAHKSNSEPIPAAVSPSQVD